MKNLFDGTVWLEKLKFPEKSQIWENHSVGDSDASADSRTTEEASTTSAIKATSTTMFIGNGHMCKKTSADLEDYSFLDTRRKTEEWQSQSYGKWINKRNKTFFKKIPTDKSHDDE